MVDDFSSTLIYTANTLSYDYQAYLKVNNNVHFLLIESQVEMNYVWF